MKKNVYAFPCLLVFFAISFSATGCRSVPESRTSSVVQLNGNPTTGYTWSAECIPSDVVEITEEFVQGGKPGMTGAPGVYYFTVTARNPGQGTIVFEYKRPWEKKEPAEKLCYSVTVTPEGELILSELSDDDNE